MIKLNSTYYLYERKGSYKLVKAHEEDLIQTIKDELLSIRDNVDKIDTTRTTPQEAGRFITYIMEEIQKIQTPYENAKENLQSIEFYLRDLLQQVEDFLNANLAIEQQDQIEVI